MSEAGEGAPPTLDLYVRIDPKRLLVDWANDQDGWVRRLAAHALVNRQPLSAEELTDLYTRFLAEKGIEGERPPVEPQLNYAGGEESSVDPLVLARLYNVAGVNALTGGYEITFSPRLTILFGENGTGKTGYARILKRLAAVRDAEEIIPNIHDSSAPPPTADLDYQLGDNAMTLHWADEVGVAPFTRLSVFDTPAVNLHVDDSLTYVYVPADLSLFGFVQAGVKHVQERANVDARDLMAGGNPFIRYFERDSAVYPTIQTLGASTDLAALASAAALPADPAGERARLEKEVAALKANTLDGELRTHRDATRTFESLDKLATTAATFDRTAYNAAVVALGAVRDAYRKVRQESFGPGELAGDPDDEWQAFITEADRYREHLGMPEDYPHDGDSCLYCRQPLGTAARDLLAKYSAYLDDALATQLVDLERRVTTLGEPIGSLVTGHLSADLQREREAGADADVCDAANRFLAAIYSASAAIAAGQQVTDDAVVSAADAIRPMLSVVLGQHRKAIEELTEKATDRQTALSKGEAALSDLVTRIELDRHLPEIRTYVGQAQRADRLRKLADGLSETLRSLTKVSKLASEELINQDFERRFREECAALRAPKVQLDFVGREGKAQRRKHLTPRHKLSQILSEGEQKVLALADFLAEAGLSGSSAPVVFDDPVNSLDHRRLEEVAARIAALAETRQVVVFTHNIWLATELLAHFEKRPDDCFYFAVTDDETSGAMGRVDRAGGPRWDTEKDLSKRVNELLDTAAKASGEVQIALVEQSYGAMRSWCEVFVEQVLFASVSQRYRANIMMTKIKDVKVDRLQPAIDVAAEVFDKACRYMADHSQPLERLGKRPSLSEAQADWQRLREQLKAYRAE